MQNESSSQILLKILPECSTSFRASFPGKWRPLKIHQEHPPLQCPNPQANLQKKITKLFWRAGTWQGNVFCVLGGLPLIQLGHLGLHITTFFLRKYHQHQNFAIQNKILRGINFVKITKKKHIFSVDPESGHSCLVFVQYPRDSPRSARELQKKSVPQRIPAKKKQPGGKFICKNFGVNGNL